MEQRQDGDPVLAGCGFSVVEKTHPSIVFTGKENQSFEHVLILTQLLHTQIRMKSNLSSSPRLHLMDFKPSRSAMYANTEILLVLWEEKPQESKIFTKSWINLYQSIITAFKSGI